MAFQLTKRGEDEAKTIGKPIGAESQVITFLYEVGKPMEIEQIMDETNMEDEKAVRVVRHLINRGLVEET